MISAPEDRFFLRLELIPLLIFVLGETVLLVILAVVTAIARGVENLVPALVAISFIGGVAIAAWLIWRKRAPYVIATQEGLKIIQGPIEPFQKSFEWARTDLLAVRKIENQFTKQQQLLLRVKSGAADYDGFILDLSTLEKPDDLLKILRNKIKEVDSTALLRQMNPLLALSSDEAKYKTFSLTAEHLNACDLKIPFPDIIKIEGEKYVLSGLGRLAIWYVIDDGNHQTTSSMTLPPSHRSQYREFV